MATAGNFKVVSDKYNILRSVLVKIMHRNGSSSQNFLLPVVLC